MTIYKPPSLDFRKDKQKDSLPINKDLDQYTTMTNNYYFVVDASAFEKGIGNIKRWDQWLNGEKSKRASQKVHIELYIPTFTIKELDFLQFRRRSKNAKEALKFIEQQLEAQNNRPLGVASVDTKGSQRPFEFIMEYEDILNTIPWSEVNVNRIDALNKIPRRFKDLLKSCTYKCRLSEDFDMFNNADEEIIQVEEDTNDQFSGNNENNESISRWILVTEDYEVRRFADQCNIPHTSIVQIDSLLSKDLNDKTFKDNKKFNDILLKNGVKEVSEDGQDMVKTKFKKTIYASRGSGKLWTP